MSLYRVTLPEAPNAYATWDIQPGLTDARGELQDEAMDARAFHELLEDEAHLQRLQSELDGAFGCVAVKDGTYGVLYEAIASTFSRGRAVAQAHGIAILKDLKQRIPTLDVAIGPDWIVEPAAGVCLWAFACEGSLTANQRAEVVAVLAGAMMKPVAGYPEAA